MLERILRFSIEHRVGVVAAVLALAAFGASWLPRIPVDAVPDITNVQVQIGALAPSLSPPEMEKRVTFVVETALAGIPGLTSTRSITRNGFSLVTAVFRDGTDIYFARQQVAERLSAARDRLPPSVEPRLGPITTGLGEIVMWTVEFEHPDGAGAAPRADGGGWRADGRYVTPEGEVLRTPLQRAAYLRTVQDWIIRPQLAGLDGLAGVDVIGGDVKQYHVEPDVWQLAAYGLTLGDVIDALDRNNVAGGAGVMEINGAAYGVRATGRLHHPDEIGAVVVAERGGVPVHVRDVAAVGVGRELRTGSASENGGEVVIGTALMLTGANSRTVAQAVTERLAAIDRTLPPDVRARVVLDRSALVDATVRTVATNLGEGAILVIAVLFAMLANFRAALIAALAIPLSMLLTAIGMAATRTSANLMSLGAIDFGLIVDGAVIIVENCLRLLAARQAALGRPLTRAERLAAISEASTQVRGATAFGEAIIVTVYIPILFLTGVEGKMFQPMALTVVFALVAAFALSLTFIPAMMALAVTGRVRERESLALRAARAGYAPLLDAAVRRPRPIVAAAVLVVAGACLLFTRLGQEFVPTLSELDLLVHAARPPGTGLQQSTDMQRDLERAIAALPEVASVFSRTGTAEMATDPMPPHVSDTFVVLRPRDQWPNPADGKADVERRLLAAIERVPGNAYELTQPIQMRFNELLAGVRGDLAIKLFGDEFTTLLPAAEAVAAIVRRIPGAVDVRVEQIAGAPVLNLEVDRDAVGRYGLDVADVHDAVTTAVGGHPAGQIFEGDRRFDVVVRLADAARTDVHALEHLPILLPRRAPPRDGLALAREHHDPPFVPLEALARFTFSEGPHQISRENGKRRIVVQANVRGRDIGSVVAEAEARIAASRPLPPGTWMTWGGQFENLRAAIGRLAVVVPICLAVIAALLYGSFGNARDAALVFTGIPLALSGGVAALWLRGMPFSITAAVGFIALSGVAVLNGLVMVTFIAQLRSGGAALDAAIIEGALTRLRPVLMTALVASLGFVPMALATGTGAEVQRPLATVVIGGLLTSTALTLVVLPALYRLTSKVPPP